MIPLCQAQNSIEAESIKEFLFEKGISSEYFSRPSGVQLGSFEVPIFVSEEDFSSELQIEVRNYLQNLYQNNETSIDEPEDLAEESLKKTLPVWTPLQALAIFFLIAMPGAYGLARFVQPAAKHTNPAIWFFGEFLILSLFILAKKQKIVDYVGLRTASIQSCFIGVGITILYFFIENTCVKAGYVKPSPLFSNSMHFAPLYTAVRAILIAPIVEETIFRGFLFKSFEKKYAWIGIVTISFLWTIQHTQYEFSSLIFIFLHGIVLGLFRLKTKSIIPPIFMHCSFNSLVLLGYYYPTILR